jgi:malate dehydrogenase (oxaloacetate-decarboxylating)(NADP+)
LKENTASNSGRTHKSKIQEGKEVKTIMTTNMQGVELLRNPSVNKGTAYSEAEKESLGLVGLLPDATESIETQLSRVLWQLKQKTSDLERYIYLMNLLEIDETLFYHTLMSDPALS